MEPPMNENFDKTDRIVIGPCGGVLTRETLPATRRIRWVARRKAEIVIAVTGGLFTLDEVCARYAIAPEEFFCWKTDYERRGLTALRQGETSRIARY
jgi:hypothetical protein